MDKEDVLHIYNGILCMCVYMCVSRSVVSDSL